MLSSRICVLCRRLNPHSSRRIVFKYYAKEIPKSNTAADSTWREFAKTDAEEKSKSDQNAAIGSEPRAKWEPLVKSNDLVKENIFTIPNALCLSRIALSPLLGYFVVNGNYVYGLSIFAYAAVTDLVDGWIARAFPSQQSVLGSALDPLADKILISVLVLSLTYVGLIPLPLTALIVGRDVGLVIAGFVMRYMTLEPPKTLARYFDITAPSVRVKPTGISKFNTGVQLSMVGLSLAAPVFGMVGHSALYAIWYLTAGTTVASGLSYVFAKDTYEVLRRAKRESEKS